MLRHVSALATPPRSVKAVCTTLATRSFSVEAESSAARRPRHTTTHTPRTEDPESRPKWKTTVVLDKPRSKSPSSSFKSKPRPKPNTNDQGKRLLRPPVVAMRVKAMAEAGKLEEAAEMVLNVPLDALNTIVWNTLLREFTGERRMARSWELYTEMKRRGFVPNCRTYQHMLQGYANIRDWTHHPKQLEHAHKIFRSYEEYMRTLQKEDPRHPELNSSPYTSYIEILSNARLYQEMFDVYNSMDEEGPLAPNHYTFATLLHMLAIRRTLGDNSRGDKIQEKNASDAKLIWRQALKSSEKNGWPMDAYVVAGIIRTLSYGKPTDYLLAFDIVREWVGFAKPGEQPLPPKVELSSHLLNAILALCIQAQKFRFCLNILHQLMEQDHPVVDMPHIEMGMRAYAATASLASMDESAKAYDMLLWVRKRQALRNTSNRSTYHSASRLALLTCWRGKDWPTALKVLELMSVYKGEDYVDGTKTPRRRQLDVRVHTPPDRAVACTLARTAFATGDTKSMRQCLRLLEAFPIAGMLKYTPKKQTWDPQQGASLSAIMSIKIDREAQFYARELAKSIVNLVDAVLPHPNKQPKEDDVERDAYVVTEGERARWLRMYMMAKTALREVPPLDLTKNPTPFAEDTLLGSELGMMAMERHVDYEMTNRHLKSASSTS